MPAGSLEQLVALPNEGNLLIAQAGSIDQAGEPTGAYRFADVLKGHLEGHRKFQP